MKRKDQKIFRQSKQRTRILELLRSTEIHPTADWFYEKLKNEFPQLSLGTVYRNLSILVEQGLAKKFTLAVLLIDLKRISNHTIISFVNYVEKYLISRWRSMTILIFKRNNLPILPFVIIN